MNRRLVGVALLLGIVTGVATACSSTSDSGTGTAAAPYEAESAGDADSSGGGAGAPKPTGQAEKGAVAEQNVSQPGVDRKLVRTATIELEAGNVGETVDRARDIAVTEGGYAGREDVRQESATLTLHIPSNRFDQALGELSELGTVISRNQTAEDVTEQVVDLDSRVATQRASVDRVRTLLSQATTVDEIVRIEQELTTRESELESLEQRRQALAGQVGTSMVTIRISRPANTPAPEEENESSGFLTGLSDGWNAFLDAGAVTLQVLGAMLPFLLVLGVPAALAVRWRRRRVRPTTPAVQQP
jgi:hypothetical protein